MTADYRDLITRMAKELDNYRQLLLDDRTVTHRLSDEARAALADEPAAPDGREPGAVTGQTWPADDQLLATLDHATASFPPQHPDAETLNAVEYSLALELRKAHAVLARFGRLEPTPPVDGEVAELVEWLQETGRLLSRRPDIQCRVELSLFTRAAELLQRQALVPVSVSERLPGPKDCDDQGRCWWLVPHQSWPCLYLMKTDSEIAAAVATHWLPAHALPLPEVDK